MTNDLMLGPNPWYLDPSGDRSWENVPRRPDGGFHLSDGTLLTDTTCRHPVTNTAMRIVNFKPGKVLDDACKGKITDYKTFAEREGALPAWWDSSPRFHREI